MTQAKIKKSLTTVATLAGAGALVVLFMRASKTAKASGVTYWEAVKTEFNQMYMS